MKEKKYGKKKINRIMKENKQKGKKEAEQKNQMIEKKNNDF